MNSTTKVSKFYRGSGSIMFAPELEDGTISPSMWALGNATGFTRALNVTKETIRDMTVAEQPIVDEPIQERDEELSFKGRELQLEHMRIQSMATDGTPITQLAATNGTITITDCELDRFYFLGARDVSEVEGVLVAAPLVLGVDFEVFDAKRGIIKLLSTATVIEDGDDPVFTFHQAAIAAPGLPVLEGSTNQGVRGRLFFFGDPSRGDTYDLTVWRCIATPDGEFGWIGNQLGEFGIKFKAVLDPDHTASLSRIVQVAAAA